MNDVPRGLLRETLRGRMTPERAAGCLDSQTLAAWSEGTLNARDREAIEEHASDCARCQALLAAMVTTAPPVAPSRWWRPSTFGWLAPLAAAAAAILLWINVPRSTVDRAATAPAAVPSAATPSAATPSAATTATPVTPAAGAVPAPIPSPSSTPPEPAARRPVETRAQARAKTARDASPSTASQRALQPDTKDAAAIPQAKGAAEPAADLPVTGKIPPAEARDAAAAAPAAPGSAGVAPVPLLPRAEPVTTTSKFADAGAPVKIEAAGGARAGGGGGGRGGAGGGVVGGVAKLASTPPEVVSPDASVRWRLLAGGQVARSIDRGATWQDQSTGVSIALTAGAAPSRDVCWLAGPGGTIVVSIDGLTWRRVAFPEAIELVSVRASDASNATVTAADGRRFTTTDGGKSWRQP